MNLSNALGFSEDTKLLMIHADDAGLSHSENMATIQSLEKGIVNSYSIMVPCPWFYEMAVFAKNNPQFDYGIHLTLTCEWETYKFGPVLPVSEVPSLVDKNGNFYKKREQLRENATLIDIKKELQAQIEKALKFGLKPSHIDSHMYSVAVKPEFFQLYKDLGVKYDLPIPIYKELMKIVGLDIENNIDKNDIVINKLHIGKFEDFEKGKLANYYESVFHDLSVGFNLLILHPAFDDNEMKGITVNHPNFGSEWRQIDFDYFTNQDLKLKLKKRNIELITWNDIKNARIKMYNKELS